jgi:hypothetical protein
MDSDSDEEKYSASEDTEGTTSHAHLRDVLQYRSLQVEIFPPASLKLRMMLVMWQVNSHNPACGHCPPTLKACSAHLY